VRGLPYDTASAYDAAGLRATGRGNCVAKAALLAEELGAHDVQCRTVSWEYELPRLVGMQERLGFRTDIHTAVQARIDGRWVLVDATHDPPLGALGLTVGRWDGCSETEPAYQPIGPCVVHGQDGPGSAQLQEAMERIGRQVEAVRPELITQYRDELNALFEGCRAGHGRSDPSS
jgi:transglutaminase-like putative cysteine protease